MEDQLTNQLKTRAKELGFARCGVAPAIATEGATRLHQWLEAGYAGEMRYLAERKQAYEHPRHVLDGVRSIFMLAMPYPTVEPSAVAAGEGRISRYAWGPNDYHGLIHSRLKLLAAFVREQRPQAAVRGVVDTAPLLEREFAQLAGLGWIGKHTLLLNRTEGSWFFLAALLTDIELAHDEPFQAEYCGTCRACLDACPTDAFPQPYVLDATRCISYLTIELRTAIPNELREPLGEWLFGCDICQDVCPWNRRVPTSEEPDFAPLDNSNPVDLIALFDLDDEAFRIRFRPTPLWRSKRRGILRNAAIVLGNRPTPNAIYALQRGLVDPESLVRGASAWALGRYPDREAREALKMQLPRETDPQVQAEIRAAISQKRHY